MNYSLPAHHKKINNYSYDTLDRIGKGFSSVVYKGTNQVTNQTVAIKAIDMKGIKDAISREMLECEIEALKILNHANILKCYDVVKQPSHCYIITEFCNQGDLSGLLKKKKRISQPEVLPILKDIVSGFIEIGNKNFLHRDLKLANIFMNDGKAIIADFGFAKKIRTESEREKYNVGSPLYMSPEALKKNVYSLKNDIWSIGVMAFEMLHGQTPWQCKTEKELIEKMTRVPVKFRETLKISEQMKDFIRKCLQVDEYKRMSLAGLKAWLNNSSVEKQTPLATKEVNNVMPLGNLHLSFKPTSNVEKLSNNQYSQRLTSRSQKYGNKQNIVEGRTSTTVNTIPKSVIEKNNSILFNQINVFRLLFKILEKIKKLFPQRTCLQQILGEEVIKRVTELKSCCEKSEDNSKYGLSMIEKYFNQKINPNVKKYKSVISDYFRKYSSEINVKGSGVKKGQYLETIIIFLNQNFQQLESEEELLLSYWMIELIGVNRNTTKQMFSSIIEPSLKLNKNYIRQRIHELY